MKCPYCGSINLIWDIKNGTVVCMDCATVIDKIYYEGTLSSSEDEIILDFNKLKVSDKTKKFLSELDRITNNNKKFKIDIYGKTRYFSEDGLAALQILEVDKKVKRIYNLLTEKGFFSGKKLKTRVALSFYLAGYRGDRINTILTKLGINQKYFKKLIYKLPKELKYKALSD